MSGAPDALAGHRPALQKRQAGERFDVKSLREKIKHLDRIEAIALVEERAQIAGECRWMAGDVMKALGLECCQPPKRVRAHAGARRVKNHKARRGFGEPAKEFRYGGADRTNVRKTVDANVRDKV